MSRSQREKGKRAERDVCAALAESGIDPDAERRLGQERDGGQGDVASIVGSIEVKHGDHVPLCLYRWLTDDVRCLAIKRNGRGRLWVFREGDALALLKLERERAGCRCAGTRQVAVGVYDEHRRFTGTELVPCPECAK